MTASDQGGRGGQTDFEWIEITNREGGQPVYFTGADGNKYVVLPGDTVRVPSPIQSPHMDRLSVASGPDLEVAPCPHPSRRD
jgi:hypothetical protein